MRFMELETERLILRKLHKDDFSIVYDWLGNSENMKYRKATLSEEEARKYLDWAISNSNEEECNNFEFATVIKETGELIGVASIFKVKDEPELGWTLHRNFWRRGYGTEMGKALLNFGFGTIEVNHIIAKCNSENAASYRIMEKIGMSKDSNFIKANSECRDMFQYRISHKEWLMNLEL